MKNVEKLMENIYLIDGFDLGMKERTGAYVLTEAELTLIETSASPSVPFIIDGLKELGYTLEDLKYIIVTHIHLDHAGGAGLLLQQCPNAKIIVHPKGFRHLSDPSRLIAGARAVYGEKFDSLFDPILPIPAERLIAMNDQDELTISADCTLTFYDTPGHANHHFSIYHPKVNGMFTGDTVGIRYATLIPEDIEFYLPSTSPNQFDPGKMLQSIELYKSLNLSYIFFGHYGVSNHPSEVYKQVSYWIGEFVQAARNGYAAGQTPEQQMQLTGEELLQKIYANLREQGVPENHDVFEVLRLDLEVCSMGLIDYLHKQK
ncbi:MBL fold metallo-hydrolase [Robertmurraya andreesenii]|uniref:Glyoxylase-like metal-dependent hydrolase (Beta-lactamase superfamily II) n=1 Tax=Anoxybacillus andreesenii TaxID=1325932 RepID=A0ABT9V4Q2_9BACL|nr:MBL fold metallo-hydrolase [Robertmurraya andreesenii]MDQ0155835.1 glyoxylase-like metal-dependent hydrolase (beta-lactamase superfamily II) [Robertmurraya andreesenii]